MGVSKEYEHAGKEVFLHEAGNLQFCRPTIIRHLTPSLSLHHHKITSYARAIDQVCLRIINHSPNDHKIEWKIVFQQVILHLIETIYGIKNILWLTINKLLNFVCVTNSKILNI